MKAISLLADRSDRFELHVWGSVHGEFCGRGNSISDKSHIKLHGAYDRDSLNDIFSKIDVLVYPSCSGDTYPLVLLEALASRTPIIAARTHGMAEIVEEGQNGKFFEPLDPLALSGAMGYFIDHPEEIVQMQQNITPPLPYAGLVDANIEIYRSFIRSV
jgi:glycosyltransferase involved in cell wall biosynthesis